MLKTNVEYDIDMILCVEVVYTPMTQLTCWRDSHIGTFGNTFGDSMQNVGFIGQIWGIW